MEYGEMMRQFRRFCAAQDEIAEQAGMDFQCEGCPLEKNSVCDNLPCEVKPEDVEMAERVVAQWAEEHQEPVYPTWYEFMRANKIIPVEDCVDYKTLGKWLVKATIQHDLAQKLGIDPVAEKRVCGGIA